MTRYHKDLYFPPTIRHDLREFLANLPTLHLSFHAEQQQREEEDRQRPVPTPTLQTLTSSTCFEVYIDNGRIEKALFRTKTHTRHDSIYVVSRAGIVITLWSNNKNDNHQTLNPNLYERQSA